MEKTMANPVLYKFAAAAKHQGREITQIVVRPPTMRDLKALEQTQGLAARAGKMIELLTGLTTREVDDLQVEDVKGLGEVAADFFAAWRESEVS
jgi:hypothetical protein